MKTRILILSICFVVSSAFLAKASKTEPVAAREPFAVFPMHLGNWDGVDTPLDPKVVSVLGVSDYVSRIYRSSQAAVGFYVGFYQTQRQGATMHSPMNCLPGSGWDVASRSYITVPIFESVDSNSTRNIEVNRIVIEKGLDRALVLYWYQAHGRVVASEYWGRVYTVLDAMSMNRTDGSLVRIIVPIHAADANAETAAENVAASFAQTVFPLLSRSLPN